MDIDWLHNYIILFLIPILVIVLLVIIYLTRLNKFLNPKIWEHPTLEGVWTFLPAQFLFILAIPRIDILYFREFPNENQPDLTIKVIGHQWYWSYEWRDGDVNLFWDSYILPVNEIKIGEFRLLEVDNKLYLPMNSFIRFIITRADVLHSWALPRIGVKVDAIPGRLNQIVSFFEFPGIFYGQCSEICGANHRFMPICIEVI